VDSWDEHEGQPVQALVSGGQVQCHEFPLVVMSSNGERDFPPAFNRRCLRVSMPDFSDDRDTLRAIVASHLGRDGRLQESVEEALTTFAEAVGRERLSDDVLATDQLLNLAYLMDGGLSDQAKRHLRSVLLQGLNNDLASPRDADS
jgi:MoxR-like ATPase